MLDPRKSRPRSTCNRALLAVAIALPATFPPGVAIGAPATEEYQLDLPGVGDSGIGGVGGSGAVEGSVGGADGVVGEDVTPDTALAALGSMLSSPLGIVILTGLVVLAAMLVIRAARPPERRA